MIADLAPYMKYRESGEPWLGQIPAHWTVSKLKHLVRFVNGFPFKPGDWRHSGVPIIRIQNLNGSKQFNYTNRTNLPESLLISPGELLFSWSGNRGTSFGPFIWNHDLPGYLNQHIFKLVDYKLDTRYLAYVLRGVTAHIEDEKTHGIIGLVHVTKPELGSSRVAIAPEEEHLSIIRFLDWSSRRIEMAIQAKRRVMALLNERRQLIIHDAVTRGLTAPSLLVPSGIPGLPDVPGHWDVQRTKNVFRLRTEKSGLAHGRELLSIYTHIGVRPRKDMEQKGNKASTTDNYWVVRKGDLIVNKLLAWMGAVGVSAFDGVTSPAYDVLNPIRTVDADYYHLLFRTKLYLSLFKQRSRGIMDMRLRLYFDEFGQIPIPVPPVSEQASIVAFCEEATSGISSTILNLKREIQLLREYRTRLLADVVTGKLDVQQAAAAIPNTDNVVQEESVATGEEDEEFAEEVLTES
jgi:type I restriction enzyme S subunit